LKLFIILAASVMFGGQACAQGLTATKCELVGAKMFRGKQVRCEVTNEGVLAVGALSYMLQVTEAGRSFPWLESESYLHIPGGIEPGESIPLEFNAGGLDARAEGRDLDFHIIFSDLVTPKPLPSAIPSVEDDIRNCFNVGSLSSEALRSEITLSFVVGGGNKPQSASIKAVGEVTGAQLQMYEAARRAVIRCGAGGLSSLSKFQAGDEVIVKFPLK
jgi:hypothetical protein